MPKLLTTVLFAGAMALGALFTGCSSIPVIGDDGGPAPTVNFVRQVKPILEAECLRCHHAGRAMRGLNLETLAKANSSWPGGPVIVHGSAQKSRVYQVIRLDVDTPVQLRDSQPHVLSFDQRETLRVWLDEGAGWPADLPPLQPSST